MIMEIICKFMNMTMSSENFCFYTKKEPENETRIVDEPKGNERKIRIQISTKQKRNDDDRVLTNK
jgi:hypothetical protein